MSPDFMNYISKPFTTGQVRCTSDAHHLFSTLSSSHDTTSDIDSNSSYDNATEWASDDEEDDYAF